MFLFRKMFIFSPLAYHGTPPIQEHVFLIRQLLPTHMISNLDLNLAGPSLCHDFWAKPCGPLLRLWWPFGVPWVIKLFHENWSFWARYGQRLPSKCVWMILCENNTHIRDPTFHHFHGSNGQNKHSHLVKRTHILPTSWVSMAQGLSLFKKPRFRGGIRKLGCLCQSDSQTDCEAWSWQCPSGHSQMEPTPKSFTMETPCCFSWHHVSLIWPDTHAKSDLRTLRQLDHDHVVVHVIFNLISTNLSRMIFFGRTFRTSYVVLGLSTMDDIMTYPLVI